MRERQVTRTSTKRLKVAATVSLGEKRFVAVIQVDGREFLVGGGASNVALLAPLDAEQSFDGLLTETMAVTKKQPVRRARKRIAKPTVEQTVEQAEEQAGEQA
jgi:flagellar biogenesis protein FliO